MDKYYEALKSSIGPNSWKTYSRIYRLLNINTPSDLKDTKAMISKFESKSPNTVKNYLAALVSITNKMGKEFEEINDTYRDMMIDYVEKTKNTGEYNEKQRANLMSLEDLEEIRRELAPDPSADFRKKNNWNQLLDFVLLSYYLLQPPRRNEVYNMKLITNTKDMNKTDNYLLWTPKKKEFIYQNYKTAGTYETQRFKLTPELERIFGFYLKQRKNIVLDGNPYLLVKFGNLNFLRSEDITKRLNKITGRNIGPSMLRHIFISETLGPEWDKMNAISAQMGHSLETQREYIKK